MTQIIKVEQMQGSNEQPRMQSDPIQKLSATPIDIVHCRQLLQRVKQIRNFDVCRRGLDNSKSSEQLRLLQNEPILHMAYRYGYKNAVNQILEEFYQDQGANNTSIDSDSQLEQNRFQKILDGQGKQLNKQTRQKLTFMGYKTTYGLQKFNLMHKAGRQNNKKNFSLQHDTKRPFRKQTQTQLDKKKYFPKQLQVLNTTLRLLPSVIKNLSYKTMEDQSEPWNATLLSAQGKTWPRKGESQGCKGRQATFFSKTQGYKLAENSKKVKDYQRELSLIIDNSQYMMNEQVSLRNNRQCQRNTVFIKSHKANQARPLLKAKPSLYPKYWPNHPQYDLTRKPVSKDPANQAKYRHNYYSAEINRYLSYVQRGMEDNVASMKQQALKFERDSLDDRYRYRLSLEKETYKRNVISLLKCKKDHYNQVKRQQVRANGIKRVAKKTTAPPFIHQAQQIEQDQ